MLVLMVQLLQVTKFSKTITLYYKDRSAGFFRRFFCIFQKLTNLKIMNFILRILLTALAVVILAKFLPGVEVAGYLTAIIVALVLAILNLLVKPLLVILTLPVTIFTLGLFLLVINAIIILLADAFVSGFGVSGFFIALLFSLLLSLFQSLLFSLLGKD